MAAGQLFWGPFGDSFGRKPIILLGVIIGAITAIILTSIHSISSFTVLRFIQRFLWSSPVVLSGALLRDLFSKDQLSRVMSTITLVFMIAPLVAPVIGGYIVKFFHWHMIFYVIGAMGFLAALLVFFVIPETHKQENRIPLRLNIIARNFMTLSKQKKCWVIWRRLLLVLVAYLLSSQLVRLFISVFMAFQSINLAISL